MVGPPVRRSSRFRRGARAANGISVSVLKAGGRTSVGRDVVGKELKGEKNREFRALFKDRGQFWVTSWTSARKLYSLVSFQI